MLIGRCHNHDSSDLMKWPNSNLFANCKHVSKTKELVGLLAGEVKNQRVKSQKSKKFG